MTSMVGPPENKEDPLLGLDESWKNWLRPQEDTNLENSYPTNTNGETDRRLVKKEEAKEEKMVVAVEAEDIAKIQDVLKEDSMFKDSTDDEFKEENNSSDDKHKPSFKITPQYESVFIQAYSSATIKEEPLEELSKIFEDTSLEFEKRKFHQQIFNEVMEDSSEEPFEELQREYINRLREVANIEIFKCFFCDYETMSRSNLKSHLFLLHKSSSLKIKMYKCLTCTFKTKSVACIKKHECENISDNNFSDFEAPCSPDSAPLSTFIKKKRKLAKGIVRNKKHCDLCTFEGEDRKSLEEHYISHKNPEDFRTLLCYVCHYESKSKHNLKKHLLRAHNIETIGMDKIKKIKCDSCDFKTDHKKSLEVHTLIHKDPNELEMFSCNMCDFKTKNKPYLKIHYLVHKNPEEIEKKYMCEICSKKFRVKSKLEFHLLTHKNNDEVELFFCSQCDYKTKLKYNLRIHMEIHQEPAFVCDTCGLQSRRKWNHEMHLLTHKNDDEVQVFKCAVCAYQTKFKDRLKRHLSKGTHYGNHKGTVKRQRKPKLPNEKRDPIVKVKKKFICDVCGIKCSQKSALNTHSLKHKNPAEIKMFRCEQCAYETRIKGNLTNHMKTHKDPSEFPTFKCGVCGLISKNKWNYKMHLLTHKNSTECEMYNCTICSYQTKFKAYLREHLKKRHNINTAGKPGRPPVNLD